MNDVPQSAVTRTAKLAGLPIGYAGRAALGLGKRIGGRSAELVAAEIQQRTAEQIFRVLGELKGGAMKMGQALSIFEAALPPEIAGPYRATLTKLQESAPPLPARTVHQVLRSDLGENWRDNFAEFDDRPVAAASIGQVHAATWRDGRRVAVKIQYPGAGNAIINDFNQLSRIGRLFGVLMPGLDVKPLLEELKARVAEELDYELEAASQQAFADAYRGDPDISVPNVVAGTQHVLVSDWMNGTPLARIIAMAPRSSGTGPESCSRGSCSPAPPGPGCCTPIRIPEISGCWTTGASGCSTSVRSTGCRTACRRSSAGCCASCTKTSPDIGAVEHELRANGFLKEGIRVDLDALRAFLAPLAEPSKVECFRFTREWMRGEAARVTDLSASNISRKFNVPPSYVLIHRVSTSGIGVLCQLECEGAFRAEVLRWMPGYLDEPDGDARRALPVP